MTSATVRNMATSSGTLTNPAASAVNLTPSSTAFVSLVADVAGLVVGDHRVQGQETESVIPDAAISRLPLSSTARLLTAYCPNPPTVNV